VNYRDEDFAQRTLDATGGRGRGRHPGRIGAEYWERNMRALAPKGRLILVGLMGGNSTNANIGVLLQKRASVRGTTLRARPLEEKAATTKLFEKSVIPHLASGRVKVVIDRFSRSPKLARRTSTWPRIRTSGRSC
jgi:NADPH2:quinone reductase